MERVVGIDLGAWGAIAAVMVDGELRTLPAGTSGRRLHGMISVDRQGAVFVDEGARRRAVRDPMSTVLTPMRMLGRFPGDVGVVRMLAHSPIQIVPGPAGHATVCLSGATYALPEIIAQLMSRLRVLTEAEIEDSVSKCVLAVPLGFNDAQRQALLVAARLAGLNVIRVLSSPMAALIGHLHQPDAHQRWLVVDAGGSQIGAAVIDVADKIRQTVGAACDMTLGALDIDAALLEALAGEFEDSVGSKLSHNLTARTRLLLAVESAKCSLGIHDRVRIRLRDLVSMAGESVDYDSFLDRSTVERMGQPYVERVLATADEAMHNAHTNASQLDGVLLVGGGRHLPNVVEDLGALAGRDTPLIDGGDALVATGTAHYGEAMVSNPSMIAEDLRLLAIEVSASDLKIATAGGYRETLIPAGAHLPISARRVFTTSEDKQTQVRILISQAPPGSTASHARLGEFVLDGLRPGPRGTVRVDVTFELDSDGLLHVSARDVETGNCTADDVRISLAVAEQALAAVCESRSLSEDTLKTPASGRSLATPLATSEFNAT